MAKHRNEVPRELRHFQAVAHDPNVTAPFPPPSRAQGLWSIGIFKGSGPFDLQPVEEYSPRQDTLTAWPVANPVLTCASLFLDDEVAGGEAW